MHTPRWIALASIVMIMGASAAEPRAATITVNTTDDELASDGDCSLREAIQAANTDTAVDACAAGSGADIIDLPAGTYVLTLTGAGEDGNATGDLDLGSDVILAGADVATTIIDGNAADRVLHIASGTTVEINDLTITNGQAPHGTSTFKSGQSGGGIFSRGSLTLARCAITGNRAGSGWGTSLPGEDAGHGGSGGGINAAGGTLTMSDCTVQGNYAGGGGGAYDYGAGSGGAGGGIAASFGLTVLRSVFIANRAGNGGGVDDLGAPGAGGRGGGIYSGGGAVLDQVTFQDNTSGRGGGGPITTGDGPSGPGGGAYISFAADVRASVFTGNRSGPLFLDPLFPDFTAQGGGLAVNGGGTIRDSYFDGNQAVAGGGLHITASGLVEVSGSTIANNAALLDGGGMVVGNTGGSTVVHNSTFSGNLLTGLQVSGSATVNHSTLAGNTGAGVYVTSSGVLSLRNTIVAGNRNGADTDDLDCNQAPLATLTSSGYNLTGVGCPAGATGDQTVTPADVFTTVLEALGQNGGLTPTHALIPVGPAVDTGTCLDAGGAVVPTDQRGAVRPVGADCDIGAYEHTPTPGSLVIVTVAEPAGPNCAYGGHRVLIGHDSNSDGVLDPGELEAAFYVCNGADGTDGGQSLIRLVSLPAGDASCPDGGQRVDAGLDNGDGNGVAGDGVLHDDEVDTSAYVCDGVPGPGGPGGSDGADGRDALIDVAVEPAGDNCAGGGTVIRAGVDDNADGVLDVEEIDSTAYVCNGMDGTDGMDGADGMNGGCSAGGQGDPLLFMMLAALLLCWRRRPLLRSGAS